MAELKIKPDTGRWPKLTLLKYENIYHSNYLLKSSTKNCKSDFSFQLSPSQKYYDFNL